MAAVCAAAPHRCRFDEAVQVAACRAVAALSVHCAAARAFFVEPVSVVLKRFVQLQQANEGREVGCRQDAAFDGVAIQVLTRPVGSLLTLLTPTGWLPSTGPCAGA